MTETEKVALLPCPFCQGTDAFVERADYSSCHVVCNNCGARGPASCDETELDAQMSEDERAEPGEMPARRLWNIRSGWSEPPGWKLVPVESTQDMQDDATEVVIDDGRGGTTALNWSEAKAVWAAMLENAPSPPERPTA